MRKVKRAIKTAVSPSKWTPAGFGAAAGLVAGGGVVAAQFTSKSFADYLTDATLFLSENAVPACIATAGLLGTAVYSAGIFSWSGFSLSSCYPSSWGKELVPYSRTQSGYSLLTKNMHHVYMDENRFKRFFQVNSTPVKVAALLSLLTAAGIGVSSIFETSRQAFQAFYEFLLKKDHAPEVNQTIALLLGNGTSSTAQAPTGVLIISPFAAFTIAVTAISLLAAAVMTFCCVKRCRKDYRLTNGNDGLVVKSAFEDQAGSPTLYYQSRSVSSHGSAKSVQQGFHADPLDDGSARMQPPEDGDGQTSQGEGLGFSPGE